MRVWADLFDVRGIYQATLNGASIDGPVRGMRGVAYTPRGARLNAVGELTFSLLLATRRAVAIDAGTTIRLYESDDDGTGKRDQGLFIVDAHSETDDGTMASFRCSDLLEELRWSLLSGYKNNPAFDVFATANDIVSRVADYTYSPSLAPAYWRASAVAGATGFYSGTSFVVEANSSLAALTELSDQTGYGFRLRADADRVVEFGDLRYDSLIRIQRAAGNPSAATPFYIRTLSSLTPKRDPQSIVTVVMPQAQGNDGATLREIWNETGNQIFPGTDGAWHLSGPISDAWYNNQYPLMRRPRPDLKETDGQDGWTYFVVNMTARNNYRERWQSQSFGEIRPASAFFSDRRAAAASLYRACVAFLQDRAQVHRALDITTRAVGDNRGLAGQDVLVVDHREGDGVVARDLREYRTIVDVTRSIDDDGVGSDRWLVDNIGRRLRDDRQVVSDIWKRMVSLTTNPRPVMYSRALTYTAYAPTNGSMFFTIPASPDERRTQVLAHISPVKDAAGQSPARVLFFAGGYESPPPDEYWAHSQYPGGTNGDQPFDADISYTTAYPKNGSGLPATPGLLLGIDSSRDLACEVPVGSPGTITVTITIQYGGMR